METSIQIVTFSIADINAAVARLAKAQLATKQAVGKVLVMAVYASIVGIETGPDSRDHVGVANALLKVLRKSMKKDAIVAFLEQYGQLYVPKGEREFRRFDKGTQADLAWTRDYVALVQDAANDWESNKPAPVVAELDVLAAMQKIVDGAAKAAKANKPVKNAEMLDVLRDALAKYHGAAIDAKIAAE